MKKDKIEQWHPDLKKETKRYVVSYHPMKGGEPVKIKMSSEHPIGSPEIINQAHLEAKKIGLKGGSIGAFREITINKSLKLTSFGKELIKKMGYKGKKNIPLKNRGAQKFTAPPKGEGTLRRLFEPLPEKAKGSFAEFVRRVSAMANKGELDKYMKKTSESGLDEPHYNVIYEPKRQKAIGVFYPKGQYGRSERQYEVSVSQMEYRRAVKPIIQQHGRTKSGAEATFKLFEPKDAKKCDDTRKYTIDGNHVDQLTGGLADKKKPEDFDPEQLAMGIKVEMEHTNDPAKAKEIAMDHLVEDPNYYTHLKAMEEKHQGKEEVKKVEIKGELPPEAGGKLRRPMPLSERGYKFDKPKIKPKAVVEPKKKTPMGDLADEMVESYSKKYGTIKKFFLEKAKFAQRVPGLKEKLEQQGLDLTNKYKKGDNLAFKHTEGHIVEGTVTDVVGSKVHLVDGSGNIWRVPEEKVYSMKQEKEQIKKTDIEVMLELKKNASDNYMEDFSKEFKKLAEIHQMPFECIVGDRDEIKYHIFKVGDCSIVHKSLGTLIDVKMHYLQSCPEEHRKLAKAMFYQLQTYYHKNCSPSIEKYIGDESMGIMQKKSLYGGQYSSPWQETLGNQLLRRWKYLLGRKRRPSIGARKPIKNIQQQKLKREQQYLMGYSDKPFGVYNKSLTLTERGKNLFKAFGIPKIKTGAPSVSTSTISSPKMPKLGAPKLSGGKSGGIKPITPKVSASKKTFGVPKIKL